MVVAGTVVSVTIGSAGGAVVVLEVLPGATTVVVGAGTTVVVVELGATVVSGATVVVGPAGGNVVGGAVPGTVVGGVDVSGKLPTIAGSGPSR